MQNLLPLVLGLIIFSFSITSILIVPFINLLFNLKLQRRKEAPKKGKVPLFDKMHDIKAGTPIGGGILLIVVTAVIFGLIFPIASHTGVYIRSAFNFKIEFFVILLAFIGFGLLGLIDDLVKIFGKGKTGIPDLGIAYGTSRRQKFIAQCVLGLVIGYLLNQKLGISFIHIPLVGFNLNLGIMYIPFAAFVIIAFSNAFNITDGLDGLASGLLMICLMAFGVIAGTNLDTPLSVFIAIWLGCLLSFLYFNIWPARIFLGDAGALSFGATLGVIGLLSGSIFAFLIIGGIYIVELLSSAIQLLGWKILKRPIFPIAPIHHTFLAKGWEEPKIVTRAWLTGLILAIFGVWIATI